MESQRFYLTVDKTHNLPNLKAERFDLAGDQTYIFTVYKLRNSDQLECQVFFFLISLQHSNNFMFVLWF